MKTVEKYLESIVHEINSSASQTITLQDFLWLLGSRLESINLPPQHINVLNNRRNNALMWQTYKKNGCFTKQDLLELFQLHNR